MWIDHVTEEDRVAADRLRVTAGCEGEPSLASQEKLEAYVGSRLHALLKRMEECEPEEVLADFTSLRKALLRATLDTAISHEDFVTKFMALLEAAEIYCNAPIVASLAPISPMVAKRLELAGAIEHLCRSTLLNCEANCQAVGADTPAWNGGYTHSEKIKALEDNRHIEPSDIQIAVSHIRGAFALPKVFHADTFSRELVLLRYSTMTNRQIRDKHSHDVKQETEEILRSPAMDYMRDNYEGKVLSREEAVMAYEKARDGLAGGEGPVL